MTVLTEEYVLLVVSKSLANYTIGRQLALKLGGLRSIASKIGSFRCESILQCLTT